MSNRGSSAFRMVQQHIRRKRSAVAVRTMEEYTVFMDKELEWKRALNRCGPLEVQERIALAENAGIGGETALHTTHIKSEPRTTMKHSPSSPLPDAACILKLPTKRKLKGNHRAKPEVLQPHPTRRRCVIEWQARINSFPASQRTGKWLRGLGLDVSVVQAKEVDKDRVSLGSQPESEEEARGER